MSRIFLILVLLVGCNEALPITQEIEIFNCQIGQKEKAYDYALKCIEFAGKGGESEPEDWLDKCESFGKRKYCNSIFVTKCIARCEESK